MLSDRRPRVHESAGAEATCGSSRRRGLLAEPEVRCAARRSPGFRRNVVPSACVLARIPGRSRVLGRIPSAIRCTHPISIMNDRVIPRLNTERTIP
jgi:hypothetical protein